MTDNENKNKIINPMEKLFDVMIAIQSENFLKNMNGINCKYLNLEQIYQKLNSICNLHKVILSQNYEIDTIHETNIHVVSLLCAETGQILKGPSKRYLCDQSATLNKDGKNVLNDAQIEGQEQSYTIRYHLTLFFNICAVKDTDANTNRNITNSELQNIMVELDNINKNIEVLQEQYPEEDLGEHLQQTPLPKVLSRYKIQSLKLMTYENYEDCLNNIDKKRQRIKQFKEQKTNPNKTGMIKHEARQESFVKPQY